MTSIKHSRAVSNLEDYFYTFRKNIIGIDRAIKTPYGQKKLVYADWIASGRLYKPIEHIMTTEIGPMVGNTHTESSETGRTMTSAYEYARHIIKEHVHAGEDDIVITAGSGMTGVVNKLIRILGLYLPESFSDRIELSPGERPVVFVTHMEHHSNQLPWQESVADVVVLEADENLRVDTAVLERELSKYEDRPLKIGAFTACSNVTGIMPPVHELAEVMHKHGGYCFVDFAASAPYVDIDMHPDNEPGKRLDAVYFSPHKFLGGPGSSGVLVFNRECYHREVPDSPGGGTVTWTNPWGGRSYYEEVELREDGGTPAFLQAMRAALSIRLKEQMKPGMMRQREDELVELAFAELEEIEGLHILAGETRDRLGIISFYVENIHYNLVVRLLNDRFGIQVRGGCSCAGTYGHFLLNVDRDRSRKITDTIDGGDYSEKPGWIRLSLHPTMTNYELFYIIGAVSEIVQNIDEWSSDYTYDSSRNEFIHRQFRPQQEFREWFEMDI